MLARRHLIIGLLGAAALAVQAIPAAAQVKWDLSTVWPETNFHTQNARRFADEVKKATNGAVEITVKSGGQLGFKGPEHLRAVRDGLVPMADILNTPRARVLGRLRQGRHRQPRPAQGGRHGGRRDPAGD